MRTLEEINREIANCKDRMNNARTATNKQQSEEIKRQQILIEALNAYTYLINEGDIHA
jgi:hypothetical protein